jgi:hypothetical protein
MARGGILVFLLLIYIIIKGQSLNIDLESPPVFLYILPSESKIGDSIYRGGEGFPITE